MGKSAIYCLQSGLYQEAIDRFEKVGNFKRIAEIYLGKLNNPMQAFKYLKRNGPVSNYYINLLFEKLYVVDLFNMMDIVSTNEEKLELLNLLESNFDNFK